MARPSATRGTGVLLYYFNWACLNVGRTEARLRTVWSRFIVLPSLADLPQTSDYSAPNMQTYQGEALQPNAEKRQTDWFSARLETDSDFSRAVERDILATGSARLVGYTRRSKSKKT